MPKVSWWLWQAIPSGRRLLAHLIRPAASRTFCTAGSNRPIRMAMMAMTTNSSIRVKARARRPPPRDRTGTARKGQEGSRMIVPPDAEEEEQQSFLPDGGTALAARQKPPRGAHRHHAPPA